MTRDELHAMCAELFPARGRTNLASLDYVEAVERDGNLYLVVRLVVWQRVDGKHEIEDVKEQEIYVPPTDAERMRAFLTALVTVLAEALVHPDIKTLMPHELLVTSVLNRPKRRTVAELEKSLLARSRLGRFVGR